MIKICAFGACVFIESCNAWKTDGKRGQGNTFVHHRRFSFLLRVIFLNRARCCELAEQAESARAAAKRALKINLFLSFPRAPLHNIRVFFKAPAVNKYKFFLRSQ